MNENKTSTGKYIKNVGGILKERLFGGSKKDAPTKSPSKDSVKTMDTSKQTTGMYSNDPSVSFKPMPEGYTKEKKKEHEPVKTMDTSNPKAGTHSDDPNIKIKPMPEGYDTNKANKERAGGSYNYHKDKVKGFFKRNKEDFSKYVKNNPKKVYGGAAAATVGAAGIGYALYKRHQKKKAARLATLQNQTQ